MKCYLYDHARRLSCFDPMMGDYTQWVQPKHYGRGKEPSAFLPATYELSERISVMNTMAVLKGIKPVMPVYRDYYYNESHERWEKG